MLATNAPLACAMLGTRRLAGIRTQVSGPRLVEGTETVPEPIRVDILHINDFHRRLEPGTDGSGGAARLASRVRQARDEHPDALLVNVGDVAGDLAAPGPDAFEPLPALFNQMGVDILTPGNHEFEDPEGEYRTLREGLFRPMKAEVVLSNVRLADGRPLEGTKPFTLRQLAGVNVAFVGAVTRSLASAVFPTAGAGLEVAPLDQALELAARQARAEGAEAVVALVHDGLRSSRTLGTQVPGVDLILAAHDHQVTPEPVQVDGPEGPVWVAEAGGYGTQVGLATLLVDPHSRRVVGVEGRMLPVTPDLAPDPDVQALVDGYGGTRKVQHSPKKKTWETLQGFADLKSRLNRPTEERP